MKIGIWSKTSPVVSTFRRKATLRFEEKEIRGISDVRRDVVEVFSLVVCVRRRVVKGYVKGLLNRQTWNDRFSLNVSNNQTTPCNIP